MISTIEKTEYLVDKKEAREKRQAGYCDWLLTLREMAKAGKITEDEKDMKITRAMLARDVLIERARTKASRDPLTGLPNRGAFNRSYSELIKRGEDFGLLILDIDHFKNVNDTLGHPAGDSVLIQLGLNLVTSLRVQRESGKRDFVGRYGGEEFVVFLPGVNNAKDLERIAERLRSNLGNNPFSVKVEGIQKEILVTASIGAGVYQGQEQNEFVQLVDNALYRAKKQGRNQTVLV